MLGVQLDLFADRHLRLEDARRALAGGRTEDARRELTQLRCSYPADAAIAAELAHLQRLVARLDEIDAMPAEDRPGALAGLAHTSSASARPWLLRRTAVALGEAWGPTGMIDGKAASVLLLAAGDPHTAWAVAAEAVGDSPRTRFLAYLADVEHRLGQRSRSLTRYREALAVDPHDVDWDELADDDVKALPDIARSELELDDGIAWAAPVGVVLRVLPLGEPPPSDDPCEGAAEQRAPLERARSFLHALLRATRHGAAGAAGATAIDARRQMRALAPRLLACYLEGR